jgi:hypothetical protein
MMNYYLFRNAPRYLNHVTAHEAAAWDVIMILKSRSIKVAPNILYQSSKTGIVYVQKVEESDYDMLDAFGVHQANRKLFSVVAPQEIFDDYYHIQIEHIRLTIALTATRRFGPRKDSTTSLTLHPRMG